MKIDCFLLRVTKKSRCGIWRKSTSNRSSRSSVTTPLSLHCSSKGATCCRPTAKALLRFITSTRTIASTRFQLTKCGFTGESCALCWVFAPTLPGLTQYSATVSRLLVITFSLAVVTRQSKCGRERLNVCSFHAFLDFIVSGNCVVRYLTSCLEMTSIDTPPIVISAVLT